MSFWPQSHFPNWLRGSLIILRHPCCRLLHLCACRRRNPLISKYPSSAHTAPQQPTAFLVYFSSECTDGPSTSSRRARHMMTLREAQGKDSSRKLLRHSDGPKTSRISLSIRSGAVRWWWKVFIKQWLLRVFVIPQKKSCSVFCFYFI